MVDTVSHVDGCGLEHVRRDALEPQMNILVARPEESRDRVGDAMIYIFLLSIFPKIENIFRMNFMFKPHNSS